MIKKPLLSSLLFICAFSSIGYASLVEEDIENDMLHFPTTVAPGIDLPKREMLKAWWEKEKKDSNNWSKWATRLTYKVFSVISNPISDPEAFPTLTPSVILEKLNISPDTQMQDLLFRGFSYTDSDNPSGSSKERWAFIIEMDYGKVLEEDTELAHEKEVSQISEMTPYEFLNRWIKEGNDLCFPKKSLPKKSVGNTTIQEYQSIHNNISQYCSITLGRKDKKGMEEIQRWYEREHIFDNISSYSSQTLEKVSKENSISKDDTSLSEAEEKQNISFLDLGLEENAQKSYENHSSVLPKTLSTISLNNMEGREKLPDALRENQVQINTNSSMLQEFNKNIHSSRNALQSNPEDEGQEIASPSIPDSFPSTLQNLKVDIQKSKIDALDRGYERENLIFDPQGKLSLLKSPEEESIKELKANSTTPSSTSFSNLLEEKDKKKKREEGTTKRKK